MSSHLAFIGLGHYQNAQSCEYFDCRSCQKYSRFSVVEILVARHRFCSFVRISSSSELLEVLKREWYHVVKFG